MWAELCRKSSSKQRIKREIFCFYYCRSRLEDGHKIERAEDWSIERARNKLNRQSNQGMYYYRISRHRPHAERIGTGYLDTWYESGGNFWDGITTIRHCYWVACSVNKLLAVGPIVFSLEKIVSSPKYWTYFILTTKYCWWFRSGGLRADLNIDLDWTEISEKTEIWQWTDTWQWIWLFLLLSTVFQVTK